MSATQLLHGWPTRRFELLRTRACDLPVSLEGSMFEPVIARVKRDLRRRGLDWFPPVYLSTGWHCPDRIPVVGVPFVLASRELRRLEKEVTNQLESPADMVRYLRHEIGHAINYALHLYETPEWRRVFGAFSRPYRHQYVVRPTSRKHVRHLENYYAQKHPDEDFAETFAVWLTPCTQWRARYEGWGALRKLEYVDRVMRELRGTQIPVGRIARVEPVERLRYTLAAYYEQQGYSMSDLGFHEEATGYVDEDLRAVLGGSRHGAACRADEALRRLRRRIVANVVHLLHVRPGSASELYDKYVARAKSLRMRVDRTADQRLLVGVTTMMTTHLLNMKYAGRFVPAERLNTCR
jgi:hypothetical protein